MRIGFLRIDPPLPEHLAAFEAGLRERGYVPGRDALVDYRFADGRADRLEPLARQLVAARVEVIVVAGNQAARAALSATRSIPIVMAIANDPVASGLVQSLAHPGGNITGNTIIGTSLASKRLELVKELLPKATRVGVLANRANVANRIALEHSSSTASRMGLQTIDANASSKAELEGAFDTLAQHRVDVVIVLEDALFATERQAIVALANARRLPTVFGQRNSVAVGGLVSYGPDVADAYRNAATFIDKIVRGARPADLPIEQPTRIEMVVNVRTAREIGVAIPRPLLLRANEVIE